MLEFPISSSRFYVAYIQLCRLELCAWCELESVSKEPGRGEYVAARGTVKIDSGKVGEFLVSASSATAVKTSER